MESVTNAITMLMAHASYIFGVFRRRVQLFVKPRTHFTTDLPSYHMWRRKTNTHSQIVAPALRKDVLIHNNTSEELIPTLKNIAYLRELGFPQVEWGLFATPHHIAPHRAIAFRTTSPTHSHEPP